jgi:hypothetical protein
MSKRKIILVRYPKHVGVIWSGGALGFSTTATVDDLLHNLTTLVLASGGEVETIDPTKKENA